MKPATMSIKTIFLITATCLSTFAIASMVSPSIVNAENKLCGKQTGEPSVPFKLDNKTNRTLAIHWIDGRCKEYKGNLLPAKQQGGGTAYPGDAFRIRDIYTFEVVKEVIVPNSAEPIIINATATLADSKKFLTSISSGDLRKSRQQFLETTTRKRAESGAKTQENAALNEAAQWQSELMARYKETGHDAVEVGGPAYASMREIADRGKYFGWPTGAEACTAHGNSNGSEIAMIWINSPTHYRPFVPTRDPSSEAGNRQLTQVGFGVAKSEDGLFYSCALFGPS